MSVVVRIAPSPTGDPHVGTAYVALFNMALRQKRGGRFILRIDDTDRTRYQADSERRILEELAWLGITFDEGPVYQSRRTDRYREAVAELVEKGAAYRCDCSKERLDRVREEQKKNKQTPRYDGHCRDRKLPAAGGQVVRLRVPRPGSTTFRDGLRGAITIDHQQVDDQVLLKSDEFPTYHLATVVDDHDFGVTHILRAEEWISSMPKHALIYEAFGWEMPEHWHVALLRNADKSKISKRKNPTSITWYREQGFLPDAMLNFLARMGYSMGEDREVFSAAEFFDAFELEKLNATGPVFDLQKLEWLDGVYIRELDDADLAKRLAPFTTADAAQVKKLAPLVKERLKKLSEFDEWTDFMFVDSVDPPVEQLVPKKRTAEETVEQLKKVRALIESEPIDATRLESGLRALGDEAGWKVRELFGSLRWAIAGKKVTPPLLECMAVLGRDACLERVDAAIERLS